MAFTWESLYSFFNPPASPYPSTQGSSSLLSSALSLFRSANARAPTEETDLPMPPSTGFARGGAPGPSPAESTPSIADSEHGYFPPATSQSPYSHKGASASTLSTASSTASSTTSVPHPHPHPTATATATTLSTTAPSSSSSNQTTNQTTQPHPRPAAAAPEPARPRDVMSRDFPAPDPAAMPSLDELLARPPGRWSLRHYVRHARAVDVARPAAAEEDEDEGAGERRRRQLEEAKRDLLRAKAELDAKGVGRI